MHVEIIELPGLLKVRLEGRLDSTGTASVESQFASDVLPRALPVVLDMQGVSFLSSIGIRLLIATSRGLLQSGSRLVLLSITDTVRQILETVGLTRSLAIAGGLEEALAMAKGQD